MIYPELDRYRNFPQQQQQQQPAEPMREQRALGIPHKLSTHDLPPPTPVSIPFSGSSSQLSASPSTKFSGSPGPGPYSRDTTPTSMSSQSPGQSVTAKFGPMPKTRQMTTTPTSTRPPTTRRRAGSIPSDVDHIPYVDPYGLAPVRESLNSSSSSSTVKDGDRNKKKGKKSKRLAAPPPSPPPRTSSQNFNRDDDAKSVSSSGARKIQKPRSSSVGASQRGDGRTLVRNMTAPPAMPIAAPARPSREGTPDIHSQLLAAAPVVHSNLSASSLPAERRSESQDRPVYDRSRNTSASQIPQGSSSNIPAKTATKSKGLGIPEPVSSSSRPSPRPAPSRTPSPNVGSSFRFPFFGRKKTGLEDSPPKATKKEAKEKKAPRKGPAAGTGHEGYGRIGAVRRRSGSFSLPSRGAPDNHVSQESLTSNDSFFSDRMNPVVIAGGGRDPSTELARTDSEQSLPRPSTDRSTFWPSPILPQQQQQQSQTLLPMTNSRSRRPSDSSDSEAAGPVMKSNLAFRRSMQRGGDRMPKPIRTDGATAPSPMTSFDTSIMSDDSHLELQREMSRGRDPAHPAPKKLTKRDRSPRKWNLFGKSRKAEATVTAAVTAPAPAAEATEKKPVAFYTMMDASDQEDLTQDVDIHNVLRSAEVYNEETPAQPIIRASPQMQPGRVFNEETAPAQQAQTQQPSPEKTRSGRVPRLQHVGRIPKVVTTQRPQQPPPQVQLPVPPSPEQRSFSRPFRDSIQSPPQPEDYFADPQSVGKGPSPTNAAGSPPVGQHEEFLRFSPRKNSDATGGTGSSTSGRYYAAVPTYDNATAVIPRPEDPPAEDEVWNEYDDLLTLDTAGAASAAMDAAGGGSPKEPPSATSSRGIPFHLETYQSRLVSREREREKPMESPTLATPANRIVSVLSDPTASSCYSADFTERICNAFQPHPSPTSPRENWWEMAQHVDEPSNEPEQEAPAVSTARKSLSPIHERDSSDASSSCCSASSSEDESPLSQVNLRVGSMTVSKWLTFGHVLFSDVRHDLVAAEAGGSAAPTERHSILVIDGLGNDDWSFYAAETYPAATFYNLSPRAPLPTPPSSESGASTASPSFPLTPPNHHQIQYTSHLDKFPFAAQSFTAVVYRFPLAAPDAHYRNVLSEARRVLKSGGYLELSILDVDLNNVGRRGRRAVRQLKEGIHAANTDINLASTADLLVRLIGRAGFYDVKAARVGVPVCSPKHGEGEGASRKEKPSLSEMMSDDSASGDDNITKMVSRVGRWWYTRCYEDVSDSAAESIWHDGRLLRECEGLGTSLRLMVCCGRAPERVTSV